MSNSSDTKRISFEKLHRFIADAFRAAGLSEQDARTGADVLAQTDAWGVFTHGTKCLPGLLQCLQAGGLNKNGRPNVVKEGGAWALVDGHDALGHVTSVFAMKTAIRKAKDQGFAYVGVRNSAHAGGAGYYSWLAAKEGLVGICMTNDVPTVAAPGSRKAVLGSNPFSYAFPAGRYKPVFLDMSPATVAGGKVYNAQAKGESIPDTWLIDKDGKPTTDPTGFPQVSTLQPAAGHKGFGIALLVEALAGIATGAGITWQIRYWMSQKDQSNNQGGAFIALDVNAVLGEKEFEHRMEALVDEIHNAPKADGVGRLYVPGEMEWERYEHAMKEGINLPDTVLDKLKLAAEFVGLDFETAFA